MILGRCRATRASCCRFRCPTSRRCAVPCGFSRRRRSPAMARSRSARRTRCCCSDAGRVRPPCRTRSRSCRVVARASSRRDDPHAGVLRSPSARCEERDALVLREGCHCGAEHIQRQGLEAGNQCVGHGSCRPRHRARTATPNGVCERHGEKRLARHGSVRGGIACLSAAVGGATPDARRPGIVTDSATWPTTRAAYRRPTRRRGRDEAA